MVATIYSEQDNSAQREVDARGAAGDWHHLHRRISWAAIFGGVILALAMQILLSMLGAGIGLGTVGVNEGTTPDATSIGIGAGIWWVVSSCLALALGGYATAWLAGATLRFDGILHGLVAWGFVTLLTLYLLTSAVGSVVGGGFTALNRVTSSVGSGISDVAKPIAQASGITPDLLQQQAQAYLQPVDPDPAQMNPQDAQKEIATQLLAYARGGADAPAAKEKVITIMAAQMKISHDDTAKKFDDSNGRLKQARDSAAQTAKKAADTTANAISKTAFAGFGVLLCGGVCAAIGALLATRRLDRMRQSNML
jgi:hypothetical protein